MINENLISKLYLSDYNVDVRININVMKAVFKKKISDIKNNSHSLNLKF